MMGLSAVHVLIFAIVAILLFGNRLPSLARSLGRSLVEFKRGMSELEGDFRTSLYSQLPYEKRFDRGRIKTITEESESKLSPLYWPALRFGIIAQAILGLLMALMLDNGRSFEFFKVAFLGHWLGILLLLARRPISPTKTDIIFVRWGTPLLMLAIGLIAPLVWNAIGQSDLNGWQRLWSGWTHR